MLSETRTDGATLSVLIVQLDQRDFPRKYWSRPATRVRRYNFNAVSRVRSSHVEAEISFDREHSNIRCFNDTSSTARSLHE